MTIGTTSGGLPYPNGDDPIRNGDNVARSLAERIGQRSSTLYNGANVASPVTLSTLNLWVNFINNVSVVAKPWQQLATFTLAATLAANPGSVEIGIRDVGAAGPWRMTRIVGIGGGVVAYSVVVPANTTLTQSGSARLISGASATIPADDTRLAYFNVVAHPFSVEP